MSGLSTLLNRLKLMSQNVLHRVYTSELVRRAFHTFWQAALGYALTRLVASSSPADTQVIMTGAFGFGLSAVKTWAIAYVKAFVANWKA